MSEFYSEEELERLLKDQLRDTLRFFPFMAMIDLVPALGVYGGRP